MNDDMSHPPTSPPPAGVPVLAAGEEFRVTEDIPGDVRLCRIRVAEDECHGCVALLGDADQRPALEYLAQAGNRAAELARSAARAEREQERLAALATWDDARVAQCAAWQRTRTPFGPTTYQQAHDATMLASVALNALCLLLDQQRAAGAVAAPGGPGRGEG